ncbi:uncharacterized protein TNCV_3826981 [Trichonephila clavipes]|nr:uncharacterized protein TNCV_3826981 [Trichonephila clavipes]
MDEILTTARDMELEVNEDNIEVLIMRHEDELMTEELLNERIDQEKQRNVSPEQEEDERGQMPTSAIKDILKKWVDVRAMVLEWHPNQADVSRLSLTSAFGATITGSSSRTKFLECSLRDFPFLPQPLQPSCKCSLNDAVLPSGVIDKGEMDHMDGEGAHCICHISENESSKAELRGLQTRYPDIVSSAFVTTRNKRQTISRSVQIKNKKPYVPLKKHAERAQPTSQKDPRENDVLLAAQKQPKFVQNGCVVPAKFHCA